MTHIRKTLTFDPPTANKIEDLRRQQTPIPSFSQLACELINRGLSGYATPLEKPIEQELQEAQDQGRRVTEILPGPDDDILTVDEEGDITKPRKKPVKPKKIIAKAIPRTIYCNECGTQIESSFAFCDACGSKITIL